MGEFARPPKKQVIHIIEEDKELFEATVNVALANLGNRVRDVKYAIAINNQRIALAMPEQVRIILNRVTYGALIIYDD